MIKKIAVADVTKGMFIQRFEGSWLEHSLWKTRFLVADDDLLARVRESGARECWIDVTQGLDLPGTAAANAPARTAAPPAAPRVAITPAASSLQDELQQALDLRARSKAIVSAMFHEARMGNTVDTSECVSLVNDVVDSVNRNNDAFISLSRLKLADEYTYMHSVAVCALMVALAGELGFDQAQCRDAGMAGLLHDLGKAAMPQEIINKPGKLTAEEFEIIKLHPVRGHAMLLEAGVSNEAALDVCLHHHERIDGTGYPDRLSEAQLSLVARMGAVCDVYDAVTSERAYKSGWDPSIAISQMASWKGHFDAEVLHAFIRRLGIYPVGSLVRLKSGKLGVVVEQNPQKLTQPKVKIFFSVRSRMPLMPKLVDLGERSCKEVIEGRESPSNWQFPNLNELWAGDHIIAGALGDKARR